MNVCVQHSISQIHPLFTTSNPYYILCRHIDDVRPCLSYRCHISIGYLFPLFNWLKFPLWGNIWPVSTFNWILNVNSKCLSTFVIFKGQGIPNNHNILFSGLVLLWNLNKKIDNYAMWIYSQCCGSSQKPTASPVRRKAAGSDIG